MRNSNTWNLGTILPKFCIFFEGKICCREQPDITIKAQTRGCVVISMEEISDAKLQEKKEEEQKKEDQDDPTKDVGEDRGEFHNLVDILFVLDATGSMGWCMAEMKKTVKKIISRFAQKQYNIKFAIELYRDHPPQEYSYIEKHFDLRNEDAINEVIDKECDVAGGGDAPEAVMDGLFHGLNKTSWRISTDGKTKSKRFLFHGCDAPPHGKEYGGSSADKKWADEGCPCKISKLDIKKLIQEKEVDYTLIKCGNQVETMESLFKECFENRFKRVVEIKRENINRSKAKAKKAAGSVSDDSCSEEECEQDGQYAMPEVAYDSCEVKCCKMDDIAMYEEREMEGLEAIRTKEGDTEIEVAKEEKKEKKGFFDSIKSFFGGDKKDKKLEVRNQKAVMKQKAMEAPVPARMPQRKKMKKTKKKKAEVQRKDESGSDELNRSMGSLVLSEVEDGLDDYFGDELKKEKKEKKQKKRRGSLDKIKPEEDKKEQPPVSKEAPVESHTEKIEASEK